MNGEARAIAVAFAIALALAPGCGPKETVLPPLGEVLVVVDTDLPVPRIINRLRIDFFTTDHVWYGTRDIARAKLADWPASFGVFLPDAETERVVVLRLRAYPQGEVRDYRGERFAARPRADAAPLELTPTPPATDEPRLVSDTGESTPTTEPAPLLTIDRLVRIRVRPAQRGAARIILRGACVGTMANVATEESCVDTENQRVRVTEEPIDPDLSVPTRSLAESFDATERCTATTRPRGTSAQGIPLYDEEVCVDGALFIFGSNDGFGFGESSSVPKRIAVLPAFRIDRFEVTVARWRQALLDGFRSPDLTPFDNPTQIPREGTIATDRRSCTWSETPLGREDYPVTCVTPKAARAFCRWLGGDLPSEPQWEYVAMEAGRAFETPLPWGGVSGVAARCEQAVFGRGALPINNDCNKDGNRYGVGSVQELSDADVSLGLGVIGLVGSVSEMSSDTFASYDSNCWNRAPLRAPTCRTSEAAPVAVRGASWAVPTPSVLAALRSLVPYDEAGSAVGFRCVRAGK